MNEQSEHLSNAQIENYGNRSSGAGPDADQHDEARINAHLADCPSCRSQLLDFHRTNFGLLAHPQQLVDLQVNTASTPDCPSEDDLRQLVAGLLPDAVGAKLTLHAATCDRCGQLLRIYTELYSDDFSPEEQAALANLQSSSAAWQKDTAQKMLEASGVQATAVVKKNEPEKTAVSRNQSTPTPAPVPKPFFWKWVFIPATAAAIAVAAITFPVYLAGRNTPEKVEGLLAQAYTEQRTIEMRWPGVAWGEPKETLGAASLDKPRTLSAAKDAIQRQTPEARRRTEWLHLQAQSEILDGLPSKQLIEDLTKLTQSQPAAQSLLFDLAIANFRMGEVADDRSYYLRAKTVLDEMLASFPPSSAALFDRAVAEERLQLRDLALADLTRCLTLESDPAWSAEIREKIKKLESLR